MRVLAAMSGGVDSAVAAARAVAAGHDVTGVHLALSANPSTLRHGAREIVSRSVEGPIVRTTYADMRARAKQVSHALLEMGVRPGDRVATLAWNTARHMEIWYGKNLSG